MEIFAKCRNGKCFWAGIGAADMTQGGPAYPLPSVRVRYSPNDNLTLFSFSGQALPSVFRIINETTRQPVANPVDKVIATGGIVGLANHTLLIARDGTETAIDDSAAPIRGARGNITGVVLVFRDVSHRRGAELVEKEAALAFARLAAIVEYSNDAVIGKTCFEPLWGESEGFGRVVAKHQR